MTKIETLLTPEEVCAVLRVKPQTLAEWRFYERELHHFVKVGNRVRYREEDLADYIEKGKRSRS